MRRMTREEEVSGQISEQGKKVGEYTDTWGKQKGEGQLQR